MGLEVRRKTLSKNLVSVVSMALMKGVGSHFCLEEAMKLAFRKLLLKKQSS